MSPAQIVPAVDPGIAHTVLLGLVRAEPVAIGPSGAALDEETAALAAELAAAHGGRAPASISGLAPARELYRAFGIDPTRTRPSSEALLRRALKGKPLPRISNAVDLCNLCALRFLLSIGLYDVDRIAGPVTFRAGAPGEAYEGIRKDVVHLEGRPVLADDRGPFGNPTSDSLRTSVTPSTRSLWMVIFAPASYPRADLEANVRISCESMVRHLAPERIAVNTSGRVIPDPA